MSIAAKAHSACHSPICITRALNPQDTHEERAMFEFSGIAQPIAKCCSHCSLCSKMKVLAMIATFNKKSIDWRIKHAQ